MGNASSRQKQTLPEDLSTAIALLRGADKILVDKNAWTKGLMRRDRHGKKPMLNRDAIAWCAAGAVLYAGDLIPRTANDFLAANTLLNRATVLLNGASPALFRLNHGNMGYVNYNDLETTTFADIKCLIRVAIRLGEHDDAVSHSRQPEAR